MSGFFKKVNRKIRKTKKKIHHTLRNLEEDALEKMERHMEKLSRGDEGDESEGAKEFEQKAAQSIPGDVKMISGCKDAQTSADVHDVGKFGLPNSHGAGGACTNALLKSLQEEGDNPSWTAVLKKCREILKGKRFTQVPQLSTSRSLNLNTPFTIRQGGGNCKALFIGINYVGQQGQLSGCHNDVHAMRNYVMNHGFEEDGASGVTCRVLMDDGENEEPKGANIIDAMRWLVAGAQAGDDLFMHYSGHGGSVRDDDGDEEDGMDETMVPVDYMTAGQIRDDDIFDTLVKMVPPDVHLTVVMDCCHSGSILDLPYMVKADDETIAEVESGNMSSTLPNPNFTGRLLQLGITLLTMHMQGAGIGEMSEAFVSSFRG